ncbi:hypothetical protein NLX83_39675 [Allokutzneria sp. A3M-2-11 16]|uniref:hypothetical protein n=1 Tax=Allokutzneria sp. A3M-2-11 16 TaxID=2962043 RepID=UPI0020B6E896|nr:hypothetical protein [Allokutzneria sp. A3M-2-11 16]MCP3805405.1 hypothetical protein [Allokutzneria sp. A3M-2-11 16]
MTESRRMQGRWAEAGLAALAAVSVLGLVGVGVYALGRAIEESERPAEIDYVAVCVDPATEARVADERCGDTDNPPGGVMWFWSYTHVGATAPGVGGQVNRSHGQYVRPPAHTVVQRGGVPREGGAVTRAGFGGGYNGGGGG